MMESCGMTTVYIYKLHMQRGKTQGYKPCYGGKVIGARFVQQPNILVICCVSAPKATGNRHRQTATTAAKQQGDPFYR